MIALDNFKNFCIRNICLRKTNISNKCSLQLKQNNCYIKYCKQHEIKVIKQKENIVKIKEKIKQKNEDKKEKNKLKQKEQYELIKIENKINALEYLFKKINDVTIDYDVDKEWIELKEKIKIRDNNSCRFYSILTDSEKEMVDKFLIGEMKIIDGAHVIRRSKSKRLKYNIDNVYCLYRYFHFCFDNLIDPFTQKKVSKCIIDNYWIRIIGENLFNLLTNKKL